MKTVAAIAVLGCVLAQPFVTENFEPEHRVPQFENGEHDLKIHYRPFNPGMVGGAPRNRWWKTADPNVEGNNYNGPQHEAWNEEASKASYWSYDNNRGTKGMKAHDHEREATGVTEDLGGATASDDSDAKLWEAYMKKEKTFSMQNTDVLDGGAERPGAFIPGGNDKHKLENLDAHADTYMMPKDHLEFFAVAKNVCAPIVNRNADGSKSNRNKDQASIISGLRARHNSGHQYQGCSLDNCAITVMYACSFMCRTCQAKWCRDQCQAQKERSGSCLKMFDDIEGNLCEEKNFEKANGDNKTLNPDAIQ